MANNQKAKENDFDKEAYTNRVTTLEQFKEDYEKNFDSKVLSAIKKDREIEGEIKSISWKMIREKIIWIILGGVGIIFIDVLIRVIPNFFD